ncbi:hypothetical protein LINPERPRIM_LOCUS30273, partial [Linum perenne]
MVCPVVMRGGTCTNILAKLLDYPTLFLLVLMIGQQSQSVTRVIYGVPIYGARSL